MSAFDRDRVCKPAFAPRRTLSCMEKINYPLKQVSCEPAPLMSMKIGVAFERKGSTAQRAAPWGYWSNRA